MGLDMYLEKRVYVGAHHEHNGVKGVINLTSNDEPIKVDLNKISYITEEAYYWRKANAIHGWFVQNVQNGADDCRSYYVSWNKLQELRNLISEILETKDSGKMPPVEGFYFGSTEVDEYYYEELEETKKMIDELTNDGLYYYSSSW